MAEGLCVWFTGLSGSGKSLNLRPGDYLILRSTERMSMDTVERLRDEITKAMPQALGRVIVLDGSLEMAVLRPEEVGDG